MIYVIWIIFLFGVIVFTVNLLNVLIAILSDEYNEGMGMRQEFMVLHKADINEEGYVFVNANMIILQFCFKLDF